MKQTIVAITLCILTVLTYGQQQQQVKLDSVQTAAWNKHIDSVVAKTSILSFFVWMGDYGYKNFSAENNDIWKSIYNVWINQRFNEWYYTNKKP